MTELNVKLKLEQIVDTSKINKNDDWTTQKKAVYIGAFSGAAFNLTVSAATSDILDNAIWPVQGQIFIANLRQVAPRPIDPVPRPTEAPPKRDNTHSSETRDSKLKYLNERAERMSNLIVNYGETLLSEIKNISIMGIGDKINEQDVDQNEDQNDDEKLLGELKETE